MRSREEISMEGSKLCCICQIEEVKYTCPACQMKTCGIECVKRHKKQYDCTGTVDTTKFLTRKDISDDSVHLKRDYNFLVGFERQVQLKKDDIKSNKSITKNDMNNRNKRFKKNDEDKRLDKVNVIFSHQPTSTTKRQNTLVIQLPSGMTRSASNKSAYDKKSSSFVWTIEWILLDPLGKEISSFLSYRLKEGLLLQDALPMNIINKEDQVYEKSNLNFYLSNVLSGSTKSVIKLNSLATIADNLKDKVVLEFPTVYITTNDVLEESVVDSNRAYFIESESSSDSSSDSDSSDSDSDEDSDSLEEESSDDEAPEEESFKKE